MLAHKPGIFDFCLAKNKLVNLPIFGIEGLLPFHSQSFADSGQNHTTLRLSWVLLLPSIGYSCSGPIPISPCSLGFEAKVVGVGGLGKWDQEAGNLRDSKSQGSSSINRQYDCTRGGEVGCGGGLHQILTITEIKRFWSKPKILGTIHDLIKTFEILKTTFRIWIKTSDSFPFFFSFHLDQKHWNFDQTLWDFDLKLW